VVSLNPAIDAEWRVASIVPGEKNELTSERRWPGGKGINVARWLKWLGAAPRLVLPLGGATGRELAAGLRAEALAFRGVRIEQASRVNVVVTPDIGTQLRFNPSWPVLTSKEVDQVLEAVEGAWRGCAAVVLSGSLVRGAPVDTYDRLVRRALGAGLSVFLDCDGEPFRRAIRSGPTLVKPNELELAQWARRDLKTVADFWSATRELAAATGGWVLASRGAAGAFLVDGQSGLEVEAPAVPVRKVRNTVGAGDAMLAAVVYAQVLGEPPQEWLSRGLQTAASAVRLAPGELPTRQVDS